MILLSDTVLIKSSPDKIFEFLSDLEDNYRVWHQEHVSFKLIGGGKLETDSVARVEENFEGQTRRFRVRFKKVTPELIDFSLGLGVKGDFIIKKEGDNVKFTSEIRLGFLMPLIGKLVDKLIIKLFYNQLSNLKNRMREEGVNLKRIMEEGYATGFTD